MTSVHRLLSIQMFLFLHIKISIDIVILYTYLQTKNQITTLFKEEEYRLY